jgi:hypothetical protein
MPHLPVAAGIQKTANAREGQPKCDPGRCEVSGAPHSELVLARVVKAEEGPEDEPAVIGEPAPPHLENCQAVARRVAGLSGAVAHVLPAALRAGLAHADVGVASGDLGRIQAKVHILGQVPVSDDVQHAGADDRPEHQIKAEVEDALPVEAELR